MSFVDAITALAERFLRERTFELVVAPAVADLQYDFPSAGPVRRARHHLALLSTFLWGAWEDATSDLDALTFAGLTLIPACYYSLMVTICVPRDSYLFSTLSDWLTTAAVILVLSLGPAIACYWPERPTRRISTER